MHNAFRLFIKSITIPLSIGIVFCFSLCFSGKVSAIAKESSITMTVTGSHPFIQLNPDTFGKSDNVSLDVSTDNFSGYVLSIASTNGTNIVGTNGQITSISSPLDETTFSTGNYTNKWGYKPSQHVVSNVNTPNTDYLPAPSAEGEQLAFTTSANQASQADNYTVSFGVRIGTDLPEGNYEYTYVLRAVANPIVYSITYDKNTTGTVTSMPVPNPQVIEIDGGTPEADSYGILSSALPVLADYSFGGWCDVPTTVDPLTHNYMCSGTTYQPGAQYPIDQTADGSNIVLYAIWIDDPFPVVWSQMGKCEFHGNAPSTITGSECTAYHNDYYIDTGIPLYSQTYAPMDYEIHMTIDHYSASENPSSKNDGQQTFVSTKVPSTTTIGGGDAAGLVVRRNSGNIDINSRINTTSAPHNVSPVGLTDLSIYRINGVLYYGLNNGPLTLIQNISNFNQYFELTTWFGAYPATSGCDGSQAKPCSTAKRFIEAEFSNMFIKLGDFDESNLHELTFINNDGTQVSTKYLVVDGDILPTFPSVSRTDWVFGGWWTATTGGEMVTAPLSPTGNMTLYARWYKPVSEAQIINDTINLSVSGTETIQILNSTDLEPYTFVSADTSIATVDDAGVVTATGPGMTTITMTGSVTGDTQTIHVTVGSVISVTFDPDFGSAQTFTRDVVDGGSFGNLPDYTRIGYTLEGWYTGHGGTGTQLLSSTVFDSNTPTVYYANWEAVTYVCKLAKATTLHKDTCGQDNGSGCRAVGYASGADIYYGQAASSSTKAPGDAYDCDVNNDGAWDDETERFYYYGTEGGNVKLIFYQSMINTDQTYTNAIGYLPTSTTWSNPNLVSFTGDFAGKVARFTTYQEALDLCGASNVNVNCQFMLEKSGFAYTQGQGYREGIWLAMDGDTPTRIQTKTRSLTHGGTTANAPKPTIEVPLEYVEPYTSPAATYDITFEPHNGETASTVTISAGDTLGSNYPSTSPLYTDHIFQGWYTAATGGSPISSSTQPAGDTTYHAQWKGTVALANITNTNINILESASETIEVTNVADIESYSFTSNDTNVAIVNATSGVVTGVSAGSTTITMTGVSGATRTINVTVTAPTQTVTIHFNTHTTDTVADRVIDLGDPVGTLPAAPAYDIDHLFQGWFTDATGGTQIDGTERPSVETTYHAQWKGTVALANINSTSETITEGNTFTIVVSNATNIESYTLSSTDSTVATVDSATGVVTGVTEGTTTITMEGNDSHATRLITITVTDSATSIAVCKLAVAGSLHTATVNSTTVEYGQIASSTTPAYGDAYDCDVNFDDNYNATNERFYYIGQNGNNAVLVAFSGFDGLTDGDSLGWHYNQDVGSYLYDDAVSRLPDTTLWDNPDLVHHSFGTDSYAARFVTASELVSVCGSTVTSNNGMNACPYFLENSAYDGGGRTGIWVMLEGTTYRRIHTGTLKLETKNNTSTNMAKPVIEIPYDLLEKYQLPPVQNYTVTFNSAGGSTVSSVEVQGGTALDTNYPTDPTKANNKFFGWYTDTTYTEEVTPETIVNDDVTYYARWVGDTAGFPILFSETNECIFEGDKITGTYCTHTSDSQYYIDSNLQLFTATGDRYLEDFEIGLTITDYSPSTTGLDSQATFVNSKQEATGNPGFVLRRNSANIQLTAKFGNSGNPSDVNLAASTLKRVRIVRRDGKMYYAWNDDDLTLWHDISAFSTRFDTEVWFGGAADSGDVTPMRPLKGKMTDMYVRIGTFEDDGNFKIQFDPRGGTASETVRYVERGQQLGTLPTVTHTGNYTFNGWFDENDVQVTATTVPNKSQTYHADWSYTSTLEPVPFDTSNNAMKGYYNIVDGWLDGNTDITQFNKDTPINNSTWGNTSVLSEAAYWDTLKTNFESNGCDMRVGVYGNTETALRWASGPNDCSKPKVYDTGIGKALNVYLYDTTTSTKGAQVYYTKSNTGSIANMIPGQTYYWEQSDDTDVYGVVSPSADHGTRLIEAGNVHNVRDLGGLPATYIDSNNQTVTGTVKYERLYRGERLWNDQANATGISNLGLTSNGQQPFIQYDLANAGELGDTAKLATYTSSPVIHYEFDYGYGDGTNYTKARNAVTGIMTDIVAHNNIYFHCRVGADRTGTTAYLLEGLLGVPDETRYEEYSLSHLTGLTDRTRYYKQKTSSNNKKFVFMMDYALTNQDIYDWYMKGSSNIVADEALVQAFRAEMIETQ